MTGPEGDDLEYDEAHAATDVASSRPAVDSIYVATQDDDADGGDWAYDMAHDVPRR